MFMNGMTGATYEVRLVTGWKNTKNPLQIKNTIACSRYLRFLKRSWRKLYSV
jgi:hypothetical protein